MEFVGATLKSRYKIMSEIGRGGMSTVYLAKDETLDKIWAIKHFKNSSEIDIQAYKKEVQLLSSLNHSDIPRIVDRIEIADNYFVVMDFVNGVTLGRKVKMEGPLAEKDVVSWAKMLCDVFTYLHTVGPNPIVYRDMKPDNIILTDSGRVKLIDFGIAKVCRRGEAQEGSNIGTVGFAAPEQYFNASNILDERTDIYSFGATLYYLVTGHVPEKPPNAVTSPKILNSAVSEGLEYIINKCTQKNPDDRYDSFEELLDDLVNIDKLTSEYRTTMKKRMLSFCGCIAVSIAFLIVSMAGYGRMQSTLRDQYQKTAHSAMEYERAAMIFEGQGEYEMASQQYQLAAGQYTEAISVKPDETEAYKRLFSVRYPKKYSVSAPEEIKLAVDELRSYVDKKNSPVYRNSELMLLLVRNCVEMRNTEYASYALTYIDYLKSSREYRQGIINEYELSCLRIIALSYSYSIDAIDFSALAEDIDSLKKDAESVKSEVKLHYYFTIIQVYSRYPQDFEDTAERIIEVGNLAKRVIDSSDESNTAEFNAVSMYRTIASTLNTLAITENRSMEHKRTICLESIKWYEHLANLSMLDSSDKIKFADNYIKCYETYTNPQDYPQIDAEVRKYLQTAKVLCEEVIAENPNHVQANIKLGMIYFYQNNRKAAAAVLQKLTILKDRNMLTATELNMYSSLKQQIDKMAR